MRKICKYPEKRINEFVSLRPNGTIMIHDEIGYLYEIDLERCTSPAELLDYVLQIHAKNWNSPHIIWGVVTAIEEACSAMFGQNAQGVFCPLGESHNVRWPPSGCGYVEGT